MENLSSAANRILEVNGKLVASCSRSNLARLLAVDPDAAQIVVLRKSESLEILRSLRTENLRLTHRISYLEEQVRDLLTPLKTRITLDPPLPRKDNLQVYRKGPAVTLVENLSAISGYTSEDLWQSSKISKNFCSDNSRSFHSKELDSIMDSLHYKSRRRDKDRELTRSMASLDWKSQTAIPSQRRLSNCNFTSDLNVCRTTMHQLSSLDFDSEPTYCRMKDTQCRASERSEDCVTDDFHQAKSRGTPPKKPARLSLHRTASLQSVPGVMPAISQAPKRPTKRTHRGDSPIEQTYGQCESSSETTNTHQTDQPPQPPPRTPSRADSYQRAFRWSLPKPRRT
ncbi:uncharacterized protein [Fopius arisanus]|uniref:Uncharacterized protein n=1 Tax=Fopius arisanus TaxID=64838 RepID=A0A9R1U9F6_9HYME|nr:PREDICTED: uncharacterized protein LOC105272698 [Fopius arisanus]